jgi:hypothetical protein
MIICQDILWREHPKFFLKNLKKFTNKAKILLIKVDYKKDIDVMIYENHLLWK